MSNTTTRILVASALAVGIGAALGILARKRDGELDEASLASGTGPSSAEGDDPRLSRHRLALLVALLVFAPLALASAAVWFRPAYGPIAQIVSCISVLVSFAGTILTLSHAPTWPNAVLVVGATLTAISVAAAVSLAFA